MKQIFLPVLCALAALSFFTSTSQAQTLGTGAGGAHRRGGTGLEQRAREIIAKFDKDGDHALNATELAAFFESVRERLSERRSQQASNPTPATPSASSTTGNTGQHHAGSPQEHAAKAIEKFDKNGDGKLEAGELVALLTAMREHLQRREQGQGQGQGRPTPTTTNTPSNSTNADGNAIKL